MLILAANKGLSNKYFAFSCRVFEVHSWITYFLYGEGVCVSKCMSHARAWHVNQRPIQDPQLRKQSTRFLSVLLFKQDIRITLLLKLTLSSCLVSSHFVSSPNLQYTFCHRSLLCLSASGKMGSPIWRSPWGAGRSFKRLWQWYPVGSNADKNFHILTDVPIWDDWEFYPFKLPFKRLRQ